MAAEEVDTQELVAFDVLGLLDEKAVGILHAASAEDKKDSATLLSSNDGRMDEDSIPAEDVQTGA